MADAPHYAAALLGVLVVACGPAINLDAADRGQGAGNPLESLGDSGSAGTGPGDTSTSGDPSDDGEVPGVEEDGDGIYAAVPHIIAIGDVHGDGNSTVAILLAAGVVDEDYNWTAGTSWVVQVGDQLDRGYHEESILVLFEYLREQAAEAGGRFIALNGNHEVMQTEGRMDYVFDREAFGGLDARIEAFAPGGPWALTLAKRNVVVKIGSTVFVHGGVLPKFAAEGVRQINADSKDWFRGTRASQPASIDGSGSVVWDRTYSDGDPGASGCATLEDALAIMGAERMVVAHTVQASVNNACNGKVWRIDTGMASYYGGVLEAIEIIDDSQVRIISASDN